MSVHRDEDRPGYWSVRWREEGRLRRKRGFRSEAAARDFPKHAACLERAKAGIFKFKGTARVDEQIACEAELMCTMRTLA